MNFFFMRLEMAMAKTDQYIKSGFFAVLLYVSLAAGVNGYLKVGFYSSNCPAAESTVFEVVRDAFINNAEVSPGLVRMHFHDCFVRVGMNTMSYPYIQFTFLYMFQHPFLSISICLP